MLKEKLSGVIVPIVTPATENDEVDYKRLENNADRLLKEKIDGLYICGGTGDGSNLTAEERKEIAEYLTQRLKEKKMASIVHVGGTHQREALALAEHAKSIGADAIASTPPKGSWDVITQYYTALAAVGIPIIMYYFPGLTGQTGTINDLEKILSIPEIVGIKVSDWNLFLQSQIKKKFPEKIVYSGYDELLLPGLLYGADGLIGTWGNLFTPLYVKMYNSVKQGDVATANRLNKQFNDFLNIAWEYGVLEVFEELMAALDYSMKSFRSPTLWQQGFVPQKAIDELLERREQILSEL